MSGRSIPAGGPDFFEIGASGEKRLADEEGAEISSIYSIDDAYGGQLARGRELREQNQQILEERNLAIQERSQRAQEIAERYNSGVEYVPGVPHQEQTGMGRGDEVEPILEQAMQGYKSVIEGSVLSDKDLKMSEVYEEHPELFKAYESLINDINSKTDQAITLELLRTRKIKENDLLAIHYYAMNGKTDLDGIIDHIRRTNKATINLIIQNYGKKVVPPFPSSGAASSSAAAAASSSAAAAAEVPSAGTMTDEDESIVHPEIPTKTTKKQMLKWIEESEFGKTTHIPSTRFKSGQVSLAYAQRSELVDFVIKNKIYPKNDVLLIFFSLILKIT
jgi:hypothetical protein